MICYKYFFYITANFTKTDIKCKVIMTRYNKYVYLAKKYRSNYINTLTHSHVGKIYINSKGFKQQEIFTKKLMLEFSWDAISKIRLE